MDNLGTTMHGDSMGAHPWVIYGKSMDAPLWVIYGYTSMGTTMHGDSMGVNLWTIYGQHLWDTHGYKPCMGNLWNASMVFSMDGKLMASVCGAFISKWAL